MTNRRAAPRPPKVVRGTIMPLFLDEDTMDEAALVVAKRLSRLADGSLTSPETWQDVCNRMNCKVVFYDVTGSGRGDFWPYPDGAIPPNLFGVVTINMAYPDQEICWAWVHELAHADLFMWHPPQLSECRDVWRYEGDSGSIHHRIARRVESLIFGVKPV